jgi:hypothetical protein
MLLVFTHKMCITFEGLEFRVGSRLQYTPRPSELTGAAKQIYYYQFCGIRKYSIDDIQSKLSACTVHVQAFLNIHKTTVLYTTVRLVIFNDAQVETISV